MGFSGGGKSLGDAPLVLPANGGVPTTRKDYYSQEERQEIIYMPGNDIQATMLKDVTASDVAGPMSEFGKHLQEAVPDAFEVDAVGGDSLGYRDSYGYPDTHQSDGYDVGESTEQSDGYEMEFEDDFAGGIPRIDFESDDKYPYNGMMPGSDHGEDEEFDPKWRDDEDDEDEAFFDFDTSEVASPPRRMDRSRTPDRQSRGSKTWNERLARLGLDEDELDDLL